MKFLSKLNSSFVQDTKLFWKTVMPFLSNKGNCRTNIKLTEKDKVMQDDQKVPKELNSKEPHRTPQSWAKHLHKVKKYSKIGQDFINIISNFACFLTAIVNV